MSGRCHGFTGASNGMINVLMGILCVGAVAAICRQPKGNYSVDPGAMSAEPSTPLVAPPGFNFTVQLQRDSVEQIYMLAGFWIESVLYGIYVLLFISYIRISISKNGKYPLQYSRRTRYQTIDPYEIGPNPSPKEQNISSTPTHPPRSGPRILFLTLISTMFLLSTYWMGVNLHRFLVAYAFTDPNFINNFPSPFLQDNTTLSDSQVPAFHLPENQARPMPIYYFRDFRTWDNFSYVIVSSVSFWIADFIAIYRCYIIWDRKYRVIVIPFLLLLASIGTNAVNFYFFLYPFAALRALGPFDKTIKPLLDFVYPGHLIQNVLTTGLVAWKIWKRHADSLRAGIRPTSSITLGSVARIVVESAMVYTLQMGALVVFYILAHPAMVIFQAAIVPSTGIVFVLMTTRIQRVIKQNALKFESEGDKSSMWFNPAWALNTNSRTSSMEFELDKKLRYSGGSTVNFANPPSPVIPPKRASAVTSSSLPDSKKGPMTLHPGNASWHGHGYFSRQSSLNFAGSQGAGAHGSHRTSMRGAGGSVMSMPTLVRRPSSVAIRQTSNARPPMTSAAMRDKVDGGAEADRDPEFGRASPSNHYWAVAV